MGAMQAAIKEWMDEIQEKSKDINKNENKEDRDREINKLFEDDPIIFLNRHDVSHTKKVMDRALELIKCFNRIDFSCYEIYFLLPDTEITRQKAAGLLIGRPRKPA